MKTLIALLFTGLASSAALADSLTTRTPAIFVGGGFDMGSTQLTPTGTASSHFTTSGWLAEVGFSSAFSEAWGYQLSVEGGQDNAQNSYSTQSYMEIGSMSFYGAKAGLYGGPFTFGGGYVYRSINVKSLSTNGNGYEQTSFGGWEPLGFVNLTFDVKQRFRTVIEAQYITGTLPGGAAGAANGELSVGVRAYLLF